MERNRASIDARDVKPDAKSWLQEILGRALDDSEKVYIVTIKTAGAEADAPSKLRALREVRVILDQAHAHSARQGVSAAEADAAVDEAMDSVRHNQ